MNTTVVEISGYATAISSLYMTNRSLTPERLHNIRFVVEKATDRFGFLLQNEYTEQFLDYMNRTITYGIRHEHWQILKFLDVHILMEGLHRGAQDDYDAHAKRMEILRSTTRTAKGADFAEFSDFYKEKILTFDEAYQLLTHSDGLPPSLKLDGKTWAKTPWGYVLQEYAADADVRRGLVGLGMASNNISKVPYGEHLRHIYNLRRENPSGKPANPELQQAMEQLRAELTLKCPPLGEYLGKVWVASGGGHYAEQNNCILVDKNDYWEELK